MRCLERLFRRCRVALGMSQGFHPKPRMTFPLALAVGIEGCDEVMELELAETISAQALLARLAPQAPPGLRFLSAEVLPPGSPKASIRSACYEVPLPPDRIPGVEERVARLLAADRYAFRRPHRETSVDLRACLEELALREGRLQMRLRTGPGPTVGPRDVLSALDLADVERAGVHVTRTAMELNA